MIFSSSPTPREEGCVAPSHGEQEEVVPFAQLRLPLETSSKSIAPDKRILYPAPHSLSYAPGRGTDVPSSQYRCLFGEKLRQLGGK
jgi:hypothetical protein